MLTISVTIIAAVMFDSFPLIPIHVDEEMVPIEDVDEIAITKDGGGYIRMIPKLKEDKGNGNQCI